MSHLSSAIERFAPPASRRGHAGRRIEARAPWLSSAALGFACFMSVVGLLAGVWAKRDRSAAPPPPVAPVAGPLTPRWIDIPRPFPTFDLAGSAFARLPLRYEARRDDNGSARQDTMTFGAVQPGQPYLRMMFDRPGDELRHETTLFLDVTRLAAGAGLAVERSGLPSSLPTRFGPFETVDVVLGVADRSMACRAFRRAADVLSVTGLACAGDDKAAATLPLACIIDKLDLLAAGDDPALRNLFVAAERQRGLGCVDPRSGGGLPANTMRPIGGT